MDEIIFRGSQKLENLQIQLTLASQQARLLFHQYSESGLLFASETWNSPKIGQLKEIAKELLSWFIQFAERSTNFIFSNINPRKIVDGIFKLMRNELSRKQLLCGCAGFLIGVMIGYSFAILTKKSTVVISQMQAAVCTNYGGLEYAVLIDDMPTPQIEESDDVLVQVKASTVSADDVNICKGYGRRIRRLLNKQNYSTGTEFPIILGRCCSGVVLDIGQKVTRFEVGDEVYLTAPYWTQGTSSAVVVAKEFRVAHKPKRIGFEGTAGLPYAGSLALISLESAAITTNNASDKRVLICGACTPAGCVLIQYCHILRLNISVTTNTRAAPAAQALGAKDIIIISDQAITKCDLNIDRIKLLQKELDLRDLYDIIFVTSDVGLTKQKLKDYCTPNGIVLSTLPNNIISDNFGFFCGSFYWSYIRMKCFLQNIFGWSRCNFGEPNINYHHLDVLANLVDTKQLESVVDRVFHPHDIEKALEHVESLDSIGSTIITFR